MIENPGKASAIVISSILVPICILATALRFIARVRSAAKLGAEDWFALLALLSFLAFTSLALWTNEILKGRNPAMMPIPELLHFLKISYAGIFFVPITQAFAKFSILLLYYRIFSINRTYALWIKGMALINLLWLISTFFVMVFECNPPAKIINPFMEGWCINTSAFLAASETPNSLSDFVIVGIAIGMLHQLRISKSDKWKLMILFAIGSSVGIIGFIKIGMAYQPGGGPYNLLAVGLWDLVQLGFAVICCCAPVSRSMLPTINVVAFARSSYASLVHGSQSRMKKSLNASDNNAPNDGGWAELGAGTSGSRGFVQTQVQSGEGKAQFMGKNKSQKIVQVQQSIEMV